MRGGMQHAGGVGRADEAPELAHHVGKHGVVVGAGVVRPGEHLRQGLHHGAAAVDAQQQTSMFSWYNLHLCFYHVHKSTGVAEVSFLCSK